MGSAKAILIAGVSSGCGKTTVSSAVVYALKRAGFSVQPFKVGPDYIDPAHLSHLAGRACRSLDVWMMGEEGVRENFMRGMEGADIGVVEGVGGIYDGLSTTEIASTAQVAKILGIPVVLVIDVWGISRTAAAIVKGIAEFDDVDVRGVILNFVGSERHYWMVKESIVEVLPHIRVLGGIKRSKKGFVPERHLGIRQASEIDWRKRKEALSEIAGQIDLEGLIELAGEVALKPRGRSFSPVFDIKVAVAQDVAFSFFYRESMEALEELGAEVYLFSPVAGEGIPPECDALVLPGGYPELFADEIMENRRLKEDIKNFVSSGMPVYAECGGLLLLGMYEILPFSIDFKDRPFLGYAEGKALSSHPFLAEGERVRGHMFHYSRVIERKSITRGYLVKVPSKELEFEEGFVANNLFATYLHTNFAFSKNLVYGFMKKAHECS